MNGNFTFIKIAVPTFDAGRLAFPTTAEGKELYEVSAFAAPSDVGLPDGFNQFRELILAGKVQVLLPNPLPLDVKGGVVVSRSSLDRNVQDQLEGAHCIVERRRTCGCPKTSGPNQTVRP